MRKFLSVLSGSLFLAFSAHAAGQARRLTGVYHFTEGPGPLVSIEPRRHEPALDVRPAVAIPREFEGLVPSAEKKDPGAWTRANSFHGHTYYSDGTLSPREWAERNYRAGIRELALTDHDTTAGMLEAWGAVSEINRRHPDDPLHFHVGIEISAGQGAHILLIDPDIANPRLKALLEGIRQSRLQKAKVFVSRLNEKLAGSSDPDERRVRLHIDEVIAVSKHQEGGTIQAPHVARVLVGKGLAKSVDEAFDKYLKGDILSDAGSTPDPGARQVLSIGRAAGGHLFLAHPYTVRDNGGREEDEAGRKLLDIEISGRPGFSGLEIYRPVRATSENGRRRADERAATYLGWAKELELWALVGPDYHGPDTRQNWMSVGMPRVLSNPLLAGLRLANEAALKILAELSREGAAIP